MRVISGKAKHLSLKTIPGNNTRPTTDRIKETLFNILQYDLYDCNFLDLFSGSGAIGIEALSRGARMCCFVDNSNDSISCIKDNLNFTKLQSDAAVLKVDAKTAIKQLEQDGIVFDFVFMDPPYNNLIEKEILNELATSSIIDNTTLIIVEASLNTKFDYLEDMGYKLIRRKDYKTNSHVFLSKN